MKCRVDLQIHSIHTKGPTQKRPKMYKHLKGDRHNQCTAMFIRLHQASEIAGNLQNYDVKGMKLLWN